MIPRREYLLFLVTVTAAMFTIRFVNARDWTDAVYAVSSPLLAYQVGRLRQ